MNELSSSVTRKSFQNQTELSRFSVSRIPFIPSSLILHKLIQLVTAQVMAFEVWSKIPHWLQSSGNEGTLPFVLFLVANVTAPSELSPSSKPDAKMQIAVEFGWYFSCWIMTNPRGWLILNDFFLCSYANCFSNPTASVPQSKLSSLPKMPYKKYCRVHLHYHSHGKKTSPGLCLTATAYEPLMCFGIFILPM